MMPNERLNCRCLILAYVLLLVVSFVSFVYLFFTEDSPLIVNAFAISRLVPDLYDIEITPFIDEMRFEASVNISVTSNNDSQILMLDVDPKLEFLEMPDDVYYIKDSGILHMYIHSNISYVYFKYTGVISNTTEGLYKTYDQTSNVVGLATQFEPNYARRVFPCYDEPNARSRFRLTVNNYGNYTVLFNTEPLEVSSDRIVFKDTPPMPPYLVAFAMGRWDLVSVEEGNITYDMYTLPGRSDYCRFALDICVKSIRFFEEYFGVGYKLNRLQYAAIPDFAAGAMENYGLVTCRPQIIDYPIANFSYKNYLNGGIDIKYFKSLALIAEVVAHENAHMWAGNLVSPKSWSHIWISEGLATLLPIIMLDSDQLLPFKDFYYSFVGSAIAFDMSNSSHSIISNDSIETVFDPIIYEKAAAILNRVRLDIGDDDFRSGLSKYFDDNTFGSADSDKLIQSLARGDLYIIDLIHRWINTAGIPTIFVFKDERRCLVLEQVRVTYSGRHDFEFFLPLTLETDTKDVIKMYFGKVIIKVYNCSIFNVGRRSLCVIHYDDEFFNHIMENFDSFDPEAQWVFIEDTLMTVKCGIVDINRLLRFDGILTDDDYVKASLAKVAKFLNNIGSSNHTVRSTAEKILLSLASDYACNNTIQESTQLSIYETLIIDYQHEELISKLESIGLTTITTLSVNESNFEYVLNKTIAESDPTQQGYYALALGHFRNSTKLSYLTDLFGKQIKWQVAFSTLSSMATNPHGKEIVRYYFFSNVELLFEAFGVGSFFERFLEISFTVLDSKDLENAMRLLSGTLPSELTPTLQRLYELQCAMLSLKSYL